MTGDVTRLGRLVALEASEAGLDDVLWEILSGMRRRWLGDRDETLCGDVAAFLDGAGWWRTQDHQASSAGLRAFLDSIDRRHCRRTRRQ